VDEFQARGIKKIYLITSDYHMRRARIIGEIVWAAGALSLPVSVPTERSPEPIEKLSEMEPEQCFGLQRAYRFYLDGQ